MSFFAVCRQSCWVNNLVSRFPRVGLTQRAVVNEAMRQLEFAVANRSPTDIEEGLADVRDNVSAEGRNASRRLELLKWGAQQLGDIAIEEVRDEFLQTLTDNSGLRGLEH